VRTRAEEVTGSGLLALCLPYTYSRNADEVKAGKRSWGNSELISVGASNGDAVFYDTRPDKRQTVRAPASGVPPKHRQLSTLR
jgi:hypothetical protein